MLYINKIIEFWISTHWAIAFVLAAFVNIAVYVFFAYLIEILTRYAVNIKKVGSYINNDELKPFQKLREIRVGIAACCIFALGSIFSRMLFDNVWAVSFWDLSAQVIMFMVFYETYSYFVHRLLHTKYLNKYHSVHHQSVRVTPWAAYSVHPVEAIFIGFSAPLFMYLFPMSLVVALMLHICGMMFTILLHSNYEHKSSNQQMRVIFSYSTDHAKHHLYGRINFGFVNRWWDILFRTNIYDKLSK